MLSIFDASDGNRVLKSTETFLPFLRFKMFMQLSAIIYVTELMSKLMYIFLGFGVQVRVVENSSEIISVETKSR